MKYASTEDVDEQAKEDIFMKRQEVKDVVNP